MTATLRAEHLSAIEEHRALARQAAARWGKEKGLLLGNLASMVSLILYTTSQSGAPEDQRLRIVDMTAQTSAQICEQIADNEEEAATMAHLLRDMVDILLGFINYPLPKEVH